MPMDFPRDPVMLLSVINTALRDYYDSLEDLCRSNGIPADELKKRLAAIDYVYDDSQNQFV